MFSTEHRPPLRYLRVEPYEPKAILPGLGRDDELVDVSSFSPYRYVVTFEMRSGWRKKWHKVRGLA